MAYAPLIEATSEGTMDWGMPSDGGKTPYSTWYRITGDLATATLPPLVLLHGGPGCTSNYLYSLADLSTTRPIIHYDQLGNGKSTHLRDRAGQGEFWTVELFVTELHALVKHLGLKEYYVLGQSWGGFLVQEFAVTKPEGLKAIVISNSAASFPEFVVACNKWREDLPPDVEATLKKHEAAKTFDDPAYLAACEIFYDRHVCRMVPNPAEVKESFDAIGSDSTVYGTMNGPSEFTVIGSLKDWTITARLPLITLPTLIVSGRYDEAAPSCQATLKQGIVGSEQVIFEESSHCPFVEEREKYMQVVGDFLKKHD